MFFRYIHYWQQTGTKTLAGNLCGKCEAEQREKFESFFFIRNMILHRASTSFLFQYLYCTYKVTFISFVRKLIQF